jgi:hypothetical protein
LRLDRERAARHRLSMEAIGAARSLRQSAKATGRAIAAAAQKESERGRKAQRDEDPVTPVVV